MSVCSGEVFFLHSPFCPTAHCASRDRGRAAQHVGLHWVILISFLRCKGRLTYSQGFLKLICTSVIVWWEKKKKGKKIEKFPASALAEVQYNIRISVHCSVLHLLHLSSYKQSHWQNTSKLPFLWNVAFLLEKLSCWHFKQPCTPWSVLQQMLCMGAAFHSKQRWSVWGAAYGSAQILLMPSSFSLHTVNWLIVGEWCFILPLSQVLWPHLVRNRFSAPADFLCVPHRQTPNFKGVVSLRKLNQDPLSVSFTGDGCGAWGTGWHVILSHKPNAFQAPANGRRQERCQAVHNWWKSWWYFNMWNLFLALSMDYV